MSSTAVLDAAVPIAAAAAAVCAHCGEPCAGDGVETAEGRFCCEGCAAVSAVLHAHGLTAYYRCVPGAGVSQRQASGRDRQRFAALDDPAVAARVVRTVGGATTATFAVPALHCASCVWLLEQLWRFDDGVRRTEVDLLRRVVRVAYDPAATSPRAIADALAMLGYAPVLEAERTTDAAPAGRRSLYLKLGVAGFAFGNMMLFSIPRYVNGAPLAPEFQRLFDGLNLAFAIPVLVYAASDWFRGAAAALRARAVTIDVPVALGLVTLFGRSVADIALGRGEGFLDSFAGLVFFLLVGRLLQHKAFEALAFDRTVRSFLPLSARVERDGTDAVVSIDRLDAGDLVRLRCGEIVPADGVAADAGAVDYAFVTGEAAPVMVRPGEPVRAGGRAARGDLRVRLAGKPSDSRLAALWSDPVFSRRKPQALTDLSVRFGRAFTVGALALAAGGAAAWWPDAATAADVATAVLIVACPCALTLAAPITLGTAMGVLGRHGCYLKHSGVLLDLARVSVVVFDKTGTLTSGGGATVTLAGLSAAAWARVRRLAAASMHPMSRALAASGPAAGDLGGVVEVEGGGLRGVVDGVAVAIGAAGYVGLDPGMAAAGRAYAVVDGTAVGTIDVTSAVRTGVVDAVRALRGRYDTWLLSGDAAPGASRWTALFGGRVRFGQSPADKLAAIAAHQGGGRGVLMVGDGLNDAGALAAADVGVAVSDDTACLVPACDALLRGDRVAALPAILRYARRAWGVVVLCLAVSVLYNGLGLWLALTAQLTPLASAILMPVSSLTVVALSAGLMRVATREVAA
jgi:Cu+-exporting ATPase